MNDGQQRREKLLMKAMYTILSILINLIKLYQTKMLLHIESDMPKKKKKKKKLKETQKKTNKTQKINKPLNKDKYKTRFGIKLPTIVDMLLNKITTQTFRQTVGNRSWIKTSKIWETVVN